MQSKEQQFIDAYDEHSDAIFRFCYSKTSHRDQALDLMQDTFTRVWKYIADGNEVDNIRALLYAIARNLIIDFYRKKTEISLDILIEEGNIPEAPESIHAFDRADARVALDLIQRLDPEHRDILLLRFVEELGPKEIAHILDERENVVSVRIHRAIKKLKTLLHTDDV